jgi:hypothetical protein
MEYLLAGVGLGGILSTLAGAEEVPPYMDRAHASTDQFARSPSPTILPLPSSITSK